MAVKKITLPDGRTFCFGRHRSKLKAKLRMRDYTSASLPAPPLACDYQHRARKGLRQMYLNDQLGDCVPAGIEHAIGVFTTNQQEREEYIFSDSETVAFYFAISGYIPGDPATDVGSDPATALNYWKKTGVPPGQNEILGAISIDASNPIEYRQAIWLFENLLLALELPEAWITPFPSESGFVWDVAGSPDPDNGHFVASMGYASTGLKIATWRMVGTMTDAAVAEYLSEANGGELYAVITSEMIASGQTKAHSGFDFAQLVADFDSMGGSVAA